MPSDRGCPQRSGMTLFEVGISLLLLLVGVLTMALFLPASIRIQEQARFQVYAAAKALDLVDMLAAHQLANNIEVEADAPWDTLGSYRSHSPDIEIRGAINRGSIIPLPLDIAYRLDSDGDEIRRILDEGGYIYYANPVMSHGWRVESPVEPQPPNEAMRLVIGVRGYAQQNAIPHFPWKGWPYYVGYPSPPVSIDQNTTEAREDPDIAQLWETNLREGTDWDWDGSASSGVRTYNQWGSFGGRGWLVAKGQLVLAMWYAQRKGVPLSVLRGTPTEADLWTMARTPEWITAMRFLAYAGVCMTRHFALEDQAARPYASAGMSRNNYHDSPTAGTERFMLATPHLHGLRVGVPLPGRDDPALPDGLGRTVPASGLSWGDMLAILPAVLTTIDVADPLLTDPRPEADPLHGHFFVTHAMIVNWHETCLKVVMDHAAHYPYDWSVYRPLNRMLMTDYPLMQWDLIPQPGRTALQGEIAGTAADPNIPAILKPVIATQWRPIAAQPILNIGHSATTRADPLDWETLRGDPAHFNLTHHFAAAERCRELVFWMVDWTAYEDCETAPSAPVDASRYPRMRPNTGNVSTWNDRFTTRYMGQSYYENEYGNPTFGWWEYGQEATRNPEKGRLFVRSMADVPTGRNVLYWTIGPDTAHDPGHTDNAFFWWRHHTDWVPKVNDRPDRGFAPPLAAHPRDGRAIPDPRMIFSGLYGADRNANQRLDRGTLPPSVRLRALEVARFNIYDPRLTMSQQ